MRFSTIATLGAVAATTVNAYTTCTGIGKECYEDYIADPTNPTLIQC